MILVARNQHDGVVVVIHVLAIDGDLSSVVDVPHLIELQAGIGGNKSVQVNDVGAILRQEWESVAIVIADYLRGRIDRGGVRTITNSKYSEVRLLPFSTTLLPKRGITSYGITDHADDLSALVDRVR
jgi:hypothetical protein